LRIVHGNRDVEDEIAFPASVDSAHRAFIKSVDLLPAQPIVWAVPQSREYFVGSAALLRHAVASSANPEPVNISNV